MRTQRMAKTRGRQAGRTFQHDSLLIAWLTSTLCVFERKGEGGRGTNGGEEGENVQGSCV